MKRKLLFTITCLMTIGLTTYAQYENDTIVADWMATWFNLDFDDPNPGIIEFEPPENNVWQIGKPNKEPFSPFNGHQAIMTDTARLLDSTIKHSFILKFHRLAESNCVNEWHVDFKHHYAFDSLMSGGYISVSYNKGLTWTNVIFDDYLYDDSTGSMGLLGRLYGETDTLVNGEPALTGKGKTQEGYVSDAYKFFSPTIWDAVLVHDIWVKFTYINLGSNNPHAGWMIDDLDFSIETWCEYVYDQIKGEESPQITIYPNPVKDLVKISYPATGNHPFTLKVFNMHGALVYKKPGLCGTAETIDISHLPNGYYCYQLYKQQQSFKGKFIIQK